MSSNISILIAEDEAQIRDTLSALLADHGYVVTAAADGNEAIPLFYGREFHLVVLDLKMPYIDGFEVLKFIKSTFPNTKVIVLTAYGDLANIERCRRLGADEVIGKPFNVSELVDTIEMLTKPKPGVITD